MYQSTRTPREAPSAAATEPGSAQDFGSNSAQCEALTANARQEALAHHADLTQRVRLLMRSALAQEIPPGEDETSRLLLLRNSAEVIDAGEYRLSVRVPTHDSADRDPPTGKIAYFDSRVSYDEEGATYDEGDPSGISFQFPEWGHCDSASRTLVIAEDDSRQSPNDLAETLIHEIQHAVDPGPGKVWEEEGSGLQGRYRAESWVYQSYASEYRARIVDPLHQFGDHEVKGQEVVTHTSERDPDDPRVRSGKLPLQQEGSVTLANQQQGMILFDLAKDGPTRWFDYASGDFLHINGYFPHFIALDSEFRKFVEAYGETDGAEGGNLVNSIRIVRLSEAVARGAAGAVVRNAALELDDADRTFLRDTARSRSFWELAVARLLPDRAQIYAAVQSIVNHERGPDPAQQEYVVVAGDTMGTIAERVLGSRTRWRDLADANPDIDPDRLEPGQRLVLP